VKNKTVIELGSGVGLCGLVAGALGAKEVFLTDLPRGVPLLHYNLHMNGLSDAVHAQQLCWGSESDVQSVLASLSEKQLSELELAALGNGTISEVGASSFPDVVLCCDLLFNDEANIDRLLWTCKRLLAQNTTVLVAYEIRDNALNDLHFFDEMQDICDVFAVDAADYFDAETMAYYTREGMVDKLEKLI